MHLAANSVYAFASRVAALDEKIVTVHQDVGLQAFMKEVARRSGASGKSHHLQDMGVMSVEQRPRIRTSSFVVFHIHLVPLLLGPRSAIGHLRRVPHQRRNGSLQQVKSRSVIDA